MSGDLYKILGVARDASQEDIKRAFRARSRACHPDHHPGDAGKEAEFKEVSAAYAVLRDPEARRQYDETGRIPDGIDIASEARGLLMGVFQKFCDAMGDGIFEVDAIKQMREFIEEQTVELENKIIEHEKKIKRNEKLAKKIQHKDGGRSLLHVALERENKRLSGELSQIPIAIKVAKKAIQLLGDYSFDVEKRQVNVNDWRPFKFSFANEMWGTK